MLCNNRIGQSPKFVLFVVYFSLFLDNMLLTVVVPIIPDVLYKLKNEDLKSSRKESQEMSDSSHNSSTFDVFTLHTDFSNENEDIGILFASKAIIQLVMNPIIGPLTNRIGCLMPMISGSLILVLSSFMFAYGKTFAVLFAARCVQGIGSACICISGMAMIADRYPDDKKRSQVMGITMGGMAAGVLAGYPFGSVMYDFVNRSIPLVIVASLWLLDSVLLIVFLQPRLEPERLLVGTSIRKLMTDPYIILTSGAICVSTFSIAVLESCLPLWLMESIAPPKWQLGTVFIPDSLGYLIGTNFFGSVAYKIGRWFTTMISLLTIGICALAIPLSTSVLELLIPHFGLGLGIGVVDASLMPLLAYLVDSRYVALYGTVYAIAQVAVCLAYSIGPLLGGHLVKKYGFTWVMRTIAILNFLYCPLCYFLKDAHIIEENMIIHLKGSDYKATENEARTGYASFSNQE